MGNIENNIIKLSSFGEIAQNEWINLTNRYKNISLDRFIIMPNHLHGIIVIRNKSNISIGDVISSFKTRTTRTYNKTYNIKGTRMWQKNYHEYVIRNEKELLIKRQYIMDNPLKWISDELYFI